MNGVKAGFVYVIQDVYTGMYKISRTKDLDRRMKELGAGSWSINQLDQGAVF